MSSIILPKSLLLLATVLTMAFIYSILGTVRKKSLEAVKYQRIPASGTAEATGFSSLDQSGFGVEMEGGKPGWNDAMNGLPGLE